MMDTPRHAPLQEQALAMVRPHLDDLPSFALAPGFSLRWYQAGDERHWHHLQQAADHLNDITPSLFGEEFGFDAAAHRQRIAFILDQETFVGTAAAWYGEVPCGATWGRVHWVAIHPSWQNRGLSKVLLVEVLRRLRGCGHRSAYLTTSSLRIPALCLYHRFGFRPEVRSDAEQASWLALMPILEQRTASSPPQDTTITK